MAGISCARHVGGECRAPRGHVWACQVDKWCARLPRGEDGGAECEHRGQAANPENDEHAQRGSVLRQSFGDLSLFIRRSHHMNSANYHYSFGDLIIY